MHRRLRYVSWAVHTETFYEPSPKNTPGQRELRRYNTPYNFVLNRLILIVEYNKNQYCVQNGSHFASNIGSHIARKWDTMYV